MHRWILTLNLCLSLLLVSVETWSSPQATSSRPFVVQLTSEPASLDPALVEDALTLRVLNLVLRGLTQYDSSGRVQLALAEKLEPGPRPRSMKAVIRRDARWSDGTAVTAADFIYAFKRSLDPGTVSRLADQLFVLNGARAYKAGKNTDFASVGIKAVGDRELHFEFAEPCSYFSHVLASAVTAPQRSGGGSYNGPYVIENGSAVSPSAGIIRLSRNPLWSGSEGGPEKVEFRLVTEDAPALALLQSGGLDVVLKVPQLEMDRLRREGRVAAFPLRATYYIAFNQRRPFWRDKEARRVAITAVDRAAILLLQQGDGEAACSWLPPLLGGATDCPQSAPPGAPAGLFKNAVAEDLALSFDSNSRNQLIAEKIQADLKKALGLAVPLNARDWKSHLQALYRGDVGIFRFGWLSPSLDASAQLSLFRSDSPNNHTGWASREYDALLDRISAVKEGPARLRLIRQAAATLDEEAVALPLFHYKMTVAHSPRAKGLKINPMGFFDLSAVK